MKPLWECLRPSVGLMNECETRVRGRGWRAHRDRRTVTPCGGFSGQWMGTRQVMGLWCGTLRKIPPRL